MGPGEFFKRSCRYARDSGTGGGGASPMPSLAVVDGGLTVPRRALDRWSIPNQGLTHVCVVGDSISQGTFIQGQNGYLDGFVNRLQRVCGVAFGGLRGAGYFGLWRSANALGYLNSAAEWTVAGVWNQTGTGTTDLVPFQAVFNANGAANVLTFTPPAARNPRFVKDLATFANDTTVAAASVGVHTNSFAGAGVLTVASTAGFPAAGTLTVIQGTLTSVITYTATTANTFTGCTFIASQDITMGLGDAVSNGRVINSATAAFVLANDIGQGVAGTNIARNSCITNVADATHAIVDRRTLAAGAAGALYVLGRNIIPGGIAAFDIVWVDGPLNGAFSYSLDGGATWTGVASAQPANPTIKRTNVVAANPASIKIRAANAAGTANLTVQAGLILYSTAGPTSGVMVHNFACDGKTYNATTVGGAAGLLSQGTADQLRIFDNNGDSTQTGSLQPSLMIFCFINDMTMVDQATLTLAQYQANIQTLINRFFGYCDLLFVNPPEANSIGSATQAACRAALKTTCAANGVAVLDLYDSFAAQGETGYAACYADGLILDQIHPSLEGHADIAGHILRMLSLAAV